MLLTDETVETISAWSDLCSMVLLVLCLVAGGLSPSLKVWRRPLARNTAIVLIFSLAMAWSAFRFVVEGIFKMPGPREFLVGTVIYLGRWMWLFWRISTSISKEGRLFEVACALRKLHTLRIGFSTDLHRMDREGGKEWNGRDPKAWEAVLRYGTRDKEKGSSYWRGVIMREEFCKDVSTWEVHVAEKKLHSDKLDKFGSIEHMQGEKNLNQAYQTFYEVVMNAVAYRALQDGEEPNAAVQGDGHFMLPAAHPQPNVRHMGASTQATAPANVVNGTAEVNFGPFFKRWHALPAEWVAQSVGAIDQRPIGWVARRVAADAIVYIRNAGKKFHTVNQVDMINKCLKSTLRSHFRRDTVGHVIVDC